MRVLIFGGTGMLGHKLWQILSKRFDTFVTVRANYRAYEDLKLFDAQRMVENIDVYSFESVIKAVATTTPDVIINCIAIVKQLPQANDPVASLTINALFPHRLKQICIDRGIRLIHISTDCVFSGKSGPYTEDDICNAEDLYGRTKCLGEINGANCLTIRTSFIGRELKTAHGLVEWFLSNKNKRVKGFTHAIYSGLTSLSLSTAILEIIERYTDLAGIYHISSDPINKYDLLCLLRDEFRLNIEIEPFSDIKIDRSLDCNRFKTTTGFKPLDWPHMIREMVNDSTFYEKWRKSNVS